MDGFSRDEIYRYARHLVLPEVGPEGQAKLKSARVLCVGVGGLGSPLALYLAAAGVGTLGLVDGDTVDASNLQRQILHGSSDVGRSKLASAEARIEEVNPNVQVILHETMLDSANALDIVGGYDIVVDGTDNFPTRYLVNDACVLAGRPNVYGSVFQWEGQLSVFATPGGPCYRCLFREPPPPGLVPNCAEGGVLGALPGIIGSAQAMETIKLILGVGSSLAGRLLIFDALRMEWREVRLRRNPECPVCGDEPTQTELIDYDVFCGLRSAGESRRSDESGEDLPSEVSPSEAYAKLTQGGDPTHFLLDVREPWEWAVGNLAQLGARLIPLNELEERLVEVPAEREVIVYCRSGQRSLRAAAALHAAGRTARSMTGGLEAYAREVDASIRVI